MSLAYDIVEIWDDLQSDLDVEDNEYKEAIKKFFNENIDNSDDLGDMLVGEDPEDFLSAIKNLDEIARE